jgi:ankyrin repeat protein
MLTLWPYVENVFQLVGILVDGGADINARDKDNETPLHTAYRNKRFDNVNYLCGCRADKDAKNNKGETPLQLAPRLTVTE